MLSRQMPKSISELKTEIAKLREEIRNWAAEVNSLFYLSEY
jgi:hypothetical protein